jgi:hypothetical protein
MITRPWNMLKSRHD